MPFRTPYKREVKRGRAPARQYSRVRRNVGAQPLRRRVRRIAAKVRFLSGLHERKIQDLAPGQTEVTDLWGEHAEFTAIADGDTDNTRNGNKIVITGLKYRGWLQTSDTAVAENTFRLIIARVPYSNAVAITDILQAPGTGLDFQNMMGFYKTDGNLKYQVLADRRFTLHKDGSSNTSAMNKRRFIRVNLRFKKGLKTKYSAAGSGTVVQGMIKMFVASDTPNAAAAKPTLYGVSRLTFRDD